MKYHTRRVVSTGTSGNTREIRVVDLGTSTLDLDLAVYYDPETRSYHRRGGS